MATSPGDPIDGGAPRVTLGTYWRTLRDLRAQQVFARARRLMPQLPASTAAAPPVRAADGTLGGPIYRPNAIREDAAFVFLNQRGRVRAPEDWQQTGFGRLWLYNLHYFDWLKEEAARGRAADDTGWMHRWIDGNPPGQGAGWEPYPASLRIVNWIIWLLTIGRSDAEIVQSLAVQARHLERNLEYHLLGNHLFANAKALIFAGAFFSGAEGKVWLERGLALLSAELREQILPDGAHFELTPMYHALILEDVLDLLGLAEAYPALRSAFTSVNLKDVAHRMLGWLESMTHPDGDIAYFNDAAFGIAPRLEKLAASARERGIETTATSQPLQVVRDSGYAVLARGPLFCIFDCGRVGPPYLPGHAHADTLSFELSLGGHRIVCNSGTTTYTAGADRHWERSTRAHAAVEIDGQSSAELWASFRVGRKPNVGAIGTGSDADALSVECEHDGYAHLRGSPLHRRRLRLSDTTLSVEDKIGGTGRHEIAARFPLHPACAVREMAGRTAIIDAPEGRRIEVRVEEPVDLTLEPGRFALGFGARVPRPVLCWRYEGNIPLAVTTEFSVR